MRAHEDKEFYDRQTALLDEIGGQLSEHVPEGSTGVALDVTVAPTPDGQSMEYSLSALEDEGTSVFPSDALVHSVRSLYLLFTEYGHPWSVFTIRLCWHEQTEAWQFKAAYQYPSHVG
jgi:hypothetical protein